MNRPCDLGPRILQSALDVVQRLHHALECRPRHIRHEIDDTRIGPTKTGTPRTVDLNVETVRRLADHKRTQAELKMRNRTAYNDLGLVFAKEWGDLHGREDSLGRPLGINNLGS